MRLEEKHIDQFIELYERKYGVLLEREEAVDMATRLVGCVRVVESNAFTSDEHMKYGR